MLVISGCVTISLPQTFSPSCNAELLFYWNIVLAPHWHIIVSPQAANMGRLFEGVLPPPSSPRRVGAATGLAAACVRASLRQRWPKVSSYPLMFVLP